MRQKGWKETMRDKGSSSRADGYFWREGRARRTLASFPHGPHRQGFAPGRAVGWRRPSRGPHDPPLSRPARACAPHPPEDAGLLLDRSVPFLVTPSGGGCRCCAGDDLIVGTEGGGRDVSRVGSRTRRDGGGLSRWALVACADPSFGARRGSYGRAAGLGESC